MPCFRPLSAFRSKHINPSGKRAITFKPEEALPGEANKLELPCGQCIGCRLVRAKIWGIRCVHESKLHFENCFLTLTFDDEHVKPSLNKQDFVRFMKRFRKLLEPKKIRFFHCGEYGDKTMRPHHHCIIFGHDFSDKTFYKQSASGYNMYNSATLQSLWPYGHAIIGSVSFDSASYVARYIVYKRTYSKYHDLDPSNPYKGITPPYITMSNRPGIGSAWYRKFSADFHAHDYCVQDGIKYSVPRYYDKLLEREDPYYLEELKQARKASAIANPDNTPDRLAVREEVQMLKVENQLHRNTFME